MADKLMIADLAPDAVFKTLVEKGLDKSDAAVFVGEWIVGEFGKGSRSFNYVQEFDAVKPTCGPKFLRSFIHQDWVDGEDTVQAGESAGEEGFNKRLHAIENDLDALGRDSANAFACLAEMRRELKNLLTEIRNEFNRLNQILAKPSAAANPPFTTIPSSPIGTGTLLGTIKFNDKPMTLWNTAQGMIMLPAAAVINPNPLDDQRTLSPGRLARFVEQNPLVKQKFPDVVSKRSFLEAFGNDRLEDGTAVRELLESIPPDAEFANLDAMTNDLIEREAAALRSTRGIETTVLTTLGIDIQKQKPTEASIEKFESIPQNVRAVLVRNGIDTVGKLSETPPRKMQEMLRREQIADVTIADAAEWTARAKTVSRLG